MQVLEDENELRGVKLHNLLWKALLVTLVQVIEKFASIDKLHRDVEVLVVLEGVLEPDNERMVPKLDQVVPFSLDVLKLAHLRDMVLVNHLQGQMLLS